MLSVDFLERLVDNLVNNFEDAVKQHPKTEQFRGALAAYKKLKRSLEEQEQEQEDKVPLIYRLARYVDDRVKEASAGLVDRSKEDEVWENGRALLRELEYEDAKVYEHYMSRDEEKVLNRSW